jgi:hypothetical protein
MPPPNDLCSGALPLVVPSTQVLNTTTATDDPATPDSDWGSGHSYAGVWFTWTVPADWSRLGVTMQDEDGNGVLTVFEGSCGALVVAADEQGNYSTRGGHTRIDDGYVSGRTYYFLVTSYDPGGVAALTLTLFHPEPTGAVCVTLAAPEAICHAVCVVDFPVGARFD